MKKIGAMGLVVGCLSLLVGSAGAGEQAKRHRGGHHGHFGGGERMFEKLDADGSGEVTSAEAQTAALNRFKKMDANGDGVVEQNEAQAHHQKRRKERSKARAERQGARGQSDHAGRRRHGKFAKRLFKKMDGDKDGKVTLNEAKAASERHFQRLDANSDGTVTREEMRELRSSHRGHKKHGKGCGRR